jgi:hypothetical protein
MGSAVITELPIALRDKEAQVASSTRVSLAF